MALEPGAQMRVEKQRWGKLVNWMTQNICVQWATKMWTACFSTLVYNLKSVPYDKLCAVAFGKYKVSRHRPMLGWQRFGAWLMRYIHSNGQTAIKIQSLYINRSFMNDLGRYLCAHEVLCCLFGPPMHFCDGRFISLHATIVKVQPTFDWKNKFYK